MIKEANNFYHFENIEAYEATREEGVTVKRIGLSLMYLNKLDFDKRQEIQEKENLVIMDAFKQAGYDVFQMAYGCLYLKQDMY